MHFFIFYAGSKHCSKWREITISLSVHFHCLSKGAYTWPWKHLLVIKGNFNVTYHQSHIYTTLCAIFLAMWDFILQPMHSQWEPHLTVNTLTRLLSNKKNIISFPNMAINLFSKYYQLTWIIKSVKFSWVSLVLSTLFMYVKITTHPDTDS